MLLDVCVSVEVCVGVCECVGISDMYVLNSVGESTPPCGTPVFSCLKEECVLLYVVYACLPLM